MFGKKSKEPVILDRANVIIGCATEPHEDAIRRCGDMLVSSGYANARYVEGMLARDRSFSTAIGNAIAIPHGEKEYKAEILHTGIVVLTYPEGIEWGDQIVKLVIGIAAKGDEHLEIMEHIVDAFDEESKVDAAVAEGDAEGLFKLLA